MTTTHRGWTIRIVIGRYSTCHVVSPDGDEHELYVSERQDVSDVLEMAKSFINRYLREVTHV